MAPDLRNTFGQLQSSSSEDEQVESVPSSSAHSTIEVEEGREVRDVEIDIDEDEETDPQAFLPSTAMTSLEVQERPTEHSSTGSEADITIASSYDGDELTERIPALPWYTWLRVGCRCQRQLLEHQLLHCWGTPWAPTMANCPRAVLAWFSPPFRTIWRYQVHWPTNYLLSSSK